MNSQAFAILEFDQLRQLVRRHAQTGMGGSRVDTLAPFDQFNELARALAETSEAIELRLRGVTFSFADITDPAESIARALSLHVFATTSDVCVHRLRAHLKV